MPNHDITIRACEAADIAQIRALYAEPQAYAQTLQLPFASLEHWEKKLAQRDGFRCLVAVRGDEVVGQLGLEVIATARRRHVATLGMGVKDSARGQGVGSSLLQAAIDLCEKWLNVSRIELEAYTDNAAALALYAKHGFEIEGTCRRYAFRDGKYVDVHIMARVARD
jgi:putative acetyltransferase